MPHKPWTTKGPFSFEVDFLFLRHLLFFAKAMAPFGSFHRPFATPLVVALAQHKVPNPPRCPEKNQQRVGVSPLKIGLRAPKKEINHLPTIDFQGQLLLVSGRVHQISFGEAENYYSYHEDSCPRMCAGYLGLMRGAWQQIGETILVGSTPNQDASHKWSLF